MIAEFTVENFLSFKERRTFSLVAAARDDTLAESNAFTAGRGQEFLKSAVIYGANASGKTSFFKALVFFLDFAVHSAPHKQAGDPTGSVPFALSSHNPSAPSSFEIVFFASDGDGGATRYRYGLALDRERVVGEYLFAMYSSKETRLFSRDSQDIAISGRFREGARGKPLVRNNCAFLSVCAQSNGPVSAGIIAYFRNIQVMSGEEYEFPSPPFGRARRHPLPKDAVLDFLKYADIQITGLKTETVPFFEGIPDPDPDLERFLKKKIPDTLVERTRFGHAVYDDGALVGEVYLDETDESAGTRRLFSYAEPVLSTLAGGTQLFIDEFDIMLHPLIIERILRLFNSTDDNPNNAQLVISCHAVNIMTDKLLRRDQIWFCEKDRYGATDLYSLLEFEGVRKDASFGKDYLRGKYGAVPYLEEFVNRMIPDK